MVQSHKILWFDNLDKLKTGCKIFPLSEKSKSRGFKRPYNFCFTVYCNSSIFIIAVNPLMCLSYKLSFIICVNICMHVCIY